MKKIFSGSLILSFFILLISSPISHSAIKSGDVCKNLGSTTTLNSKRFVCVKIGKRFVWSRSTSVYKPTPSPTATPTPTPTQASTTVVSPENTLNSFSDLYDNYKSIPEVVWAEGQKLALHGIEKTNFEIQFGPNTKLQSEIGSPNVYLNKASRLWSSFSQPKVTKAFFYNFSDLRWVQNTNISLGGSWHKPEDLASNCKSLTECSSFGGAYKGLGQLFIGQSNQDQNTFNLGYVRGNFAHEYTHTVQYTQLNAPANVKLPCWFAEGQAQVVGQSLGFESLFDYKKSRLGWLMQSPGNLIDYSPKSILKFYEETGGSGNGICNQSFRPRVYDIGYFTVEALSSIKGIEASMDLVASVGKGNSFESSFFNAYGIKWDDAAPILARTISEMFLGKSN